MALKTKSEREFPDSTQTENVKNAVVFMYLANVIRKLSQDNMPE